MHSSEQLQHPHTTLRPSRASTHDDFSLESGGFEVLDPYYPSISLQIQNRRRQTVNSTDEIASSYTSTFARSTRPSFEKNRSVQNINRTEGRPSTESAQNLGMEATGVEIPREMMERRRAPVSRGSTLDGVSPYAPATIARRNPIDVRYGHPQPAVHESYGASLAVEASSDVRPAHSSPGRGDLRQTFSARSLLSAYVRSSRPTDRESHFFERGRMPTVVSLQESLMATDIERAAESLPSSVHGSLAFAARDPNIPLRLYIATFLTIIVQQLYLHFLLRLPYMYYSRVTQIFADAHLTLEQMKELTLWDIVDDQHRCPLGSQMPRAYRRLKKNWESFIDNVLREWKTLNIISGLLLSGILTIFQINGADSDPITRYMAFWSLISALLSLMYGCFFIIRFSNMRRVYKATEWAIEAQKKHTLFWNVWVMLAMPAIWLVWSIIAYIACVMSFMWRVRPNDPNALVRPVVGPTAEAGFRIFICCVLGVGVLYAILIINTLRHYGSKMDRMWSRRIDGFRKQQEASTCPPDGPSIPVQSPPIRFNQIIPPTPPQVFAQPGLSPSPPAPTTPPFIPPRPLSSTMRPSSSPPAGRRPDDLLALRASESHVHSLNSMEVRSVLGSPILSGSRQRLSPDIESEFLEVVRNSLDHEACDALPRPGGLLGLYLPQEPGGPHSPDTMEASNARENEMRPIEEVDGESEESKSPRSPSEGKSSTMIAEQHQTPPDSDASGVGSAPRKDLRSRQGVRRIELL